MRAVTITTDGACLPNPGCGGWAAIIKDSDMGLKEIWGSELHTTNNRMELTAALKALSQLVEPSSIVLESDSQYLVNGMTEWMPAWKAKQFQSVKNSELWHALDQVSARHSVSWRWIRGHSGHPANERCDALAQAAALRTYTRSVLQGAPMIGSEGQCRWAANIRNAMLKLLTMKVEELKQKLTDTVGSEQVGQIHKAIAEALTGIFKVNVAPWWIDHRQSSWRDMLGSVMVDVHDRQYLLRDAVQQLCD